MNTLSLEITSRKNRMSSILPQAGAELNGSDEAGIQKRLNELPAIHRNMKCERAAFVIRQIVTHCVTNLLLSANGS